MDFLSTAENESTEGPNDDINASEADAPSASSDINGGSGANEEASEAGTEEINTGMPVSMALRSLSLVRQIF